ncbi:methyltransferase [Halomonas sp. SSL-5]|uniref:methyltransferase n=1 Tax=Halomonas sp. SSL-5 TaxID=3065855 RepID=UPI002739FB95|nr:methyltransferase [Halomonas sp. SSL-5]MDY7115206.1 methyltransferase [Halomonas sp. SSL-5]
MNTSDDARRRLERLTELLAAWQPLWQPLPFQHPRLPWQAEWPAMVEALLALSDAEVSRLQDAPFTDPPLAAWLPVAELEGLASLPQLPGEGETLAQGWATHVGGRKWRQIEAFLPRVRLAAGDRPLEWCAGKGHLARTLARRHGVEVSALEWDAALCDGGAALAEAQDVPLTLVQQDVMAADVACWLTPTTHVSALHACGDLHRRLLEQAVAAGSALTLAPCCYQRTADAGYRPLSRLGADGMARHHLSLSREDLAMAVQETVTAPRHVQRHRQRANAWRLGFDRLQRAVRGQDDYLPVPSLAYGRMPGSFVDFCHWAAEQKGIALPDDSDWAGLEASGWRRQAEVARLELVRHLFRRPLEVWLALDRLVFLEEAGYDAQIGTFCDRELTPRNLLIRARRPATA